MPTLAGTPLLNFLLAAYCAHAGISSVLRIRIAGAETLGTRLGMVTGRAIRGASLVAGALGLVFLWKGAVIVAALALSASLPSRFREFTRGFAEGRKAAELACADEYVRGRVVPQRADIAVGIAVTALAYGTPILLMLLIAMR